MLHQHFYSQQQQLVLQQLMKELNAALFEAIWEQDLEGVRSALQKGASPNAFDEDGATPLSAAVAVENIEIIKLLINSGAKLERRDRGDHDTPLIASIVWSRFSAAFVLIEAGADVNARDRRKERVLSLAIAKGNLELVRKLVEKGADTHYDATFDLPSAIEQAIAYNNIEMINLLESLGCNLIENHTRIFRFGIKRGITMFNFLIEKGLDINLVENYPDGDTPLMACIFSEKLEIAEKLIEMGVDLTSVSPKGKTALSIAESNKYEIATNKKYRKFLNFLRKKVENLS